MTDLSWYPLYIGDHMRNTTGMTEVERVTYFEILLRYQYIRPMPSDPNLLSQRLGLSAKTVADANPARWRFIQQEDNGLIWPTFDDLLARQNALREKNSRRARRAVQAREERRRDAADSSAPRRTSPKTRTIPRTKEDDLQDHLRDDRGWGPDAFSDLN